MIQFYRFPQLFSQFYSTDILVSRLYVSIQ